MLGFQPQLIVIEGLSQLIWKIFLRQPPAFGACFIALFLFQRWSIQTPLLALFRAAIHWLSSLSCIYAINIHITENRKPHRTNMVCLFNDFNYAAGYFAPNNILRCIMI